MSSAYRGDSLNGPAVQSLAGAREIVETAASGNETDDAEEDTDDEPGRITSGSPSPDSTETTLDQAILAGSQELVQRLLVDICARVPDAKAIAIATLLAPLPSVPSSCKRKFFEVCRNCKVEYNVTSNDKGDCVFHKGRTYLPSMFIRADQQYRRQGRRR